ncbi:toxin-antitoxin system YwqK family antitoxin [Janthinobacterium sp. SUN033]|uniref:toxin-antitoxin system YwqK family antitoxin n=1 Tax=Janthinobacterium sp. SUN033 TaxID=3002439 RepID=UPI0025B00BC8|nr:toxin-antitoxin system YwqK family antitoxin [Janthinobacterium sp. SUN033]MDN2678441.1 toxin-antitoxin system YwqK family antitoxin [Janthinobacterium sp. SUN033]
MKILTSVLLASVLAGSPSVSMASAPATPAVAAEPSPASLYFDGDYQPVAPAAAVYEQRAPLRHDAARQAWHWQLHFAQPPGKLHMDAWLLGTDVASPRYTGRRSVYFADGQLGLLEERNGEGDFNGVNVEYYADGTVKSRKAYRDGEYDGLHSHFHANGQLRHALLYQAGQPADGEFLSFDEHGQVSNRAHFADGVLTGEVTAFHADGRLAERGPYLDGQRNGLHQAWWPDGREMSRLNFLHGKPQGWSLLYFANGQLDQKNLFEDGVMLSTQSWRDDGTPLRQRQQDAQGRAQGEDRQWHANGTLARLASYRDGEPHGAWREWHADGSARHAVDYARGRKQGLERAWAGDGTRTVCEWQDGRLLRACRNF